MTDADWGELWIKFAREKGMRHRHFSERRGSFHCYVCGGFIKHHEFRKDIMRRRRWEWAHRVDCPRRVVRALAPVAAIVSAWSDRDRQLEADLIAQSALDGTGTVSQVLEDFYLEKNFLVTVKRALRKWKKAEQKKAEALASPTGFALKRECGCVDVVSASSEYTELCPRHAMGPRFAAVRS